jgi:hypothetical protein
VVVVVLSWVSKALALAMVSSLVLRVLVLLLRAETWP